MNSRNMFLSGLVAVLLGLSFSVRAQEFISPGGSVTLELPLENEDPSADTAQGVRIVPTFEEVSPPSLSSFLSVDEAGSILGPTSIEVGAENAQTFKIKVVVDASADTDGRFKVRLHPTFDNPDYFVSPGPDTLDTSVNNNIADPHFLVGAEKLMFPDFATRNARKPGFGDLCYSETHARSITARGYLAGVRV